MQKTFYIVKDIDIDRRGTPRHKVHVMYNKCDHQSVFTLIDFRVFDFIHGIVKGLTDRVGVNCTQCSMCIVHDWMF